MMGFRLAEAEDAQAIGVLIQECFQEKPYLAQIKSCLEHAPDRAVYVATEDEQIVGFVAGFTTTSADDILRWEIDLLAVRPAYQGRGIGRQLITTSLERGRRTGAVLARALIGEKNAASQRVFASSGFIASEPMTLYTWSPTAHDTVISRFNLIKEVIPGVIPVSTLTYRGVWLEGPLTEKMIQAAKQRAYKGEVSMAGTVVSRRQDDTVKSLSRWHFKEGAVHRHWQKRF